MVEEVEIVRESKEEAVCFNEVIRQSEDRIGDSWGEKS